METCMENNNYLIQKNERKKRCGFHVVLNSKRA